MEVRALGQEGIVSSYRDYLDLPLAVLEDWRLLKKHEAIKAKREATRGRARVR